MPITRIPFGQWLPDQGSLGNPGALVATNVIPEGGTYYPFKALQATSTTPLSAYARGAISVTGSDGNNYNYAGDATKLYLLSTAIWTDASRTSGGAYTTGSEERWDFAKFGEKVIAVNWNDAPQIITLGGANFAALGGTPPKARCVAVVGDFVVMGNIDDGTPKFNKVRWSAFGDEATWTGTPNNQADEQELEGNYGAIVRIIGGDTGHIFRERGIISMRREGPPTIFGFYPVERNRGPIAHGAVCDAGNMMFFISNDDIYMFDGQQCQNIGATKVAKTILDDIDVAYHYRITSASDIRRSLVMWSYPGSGNDNGTPNKIAIYHWPSGSWAIAEVECNCLYVYISPGYTLEGLDSISTSLDALTASLDSATYQGGDLSLGAFSTAHNSGTFDGTALSATIDTKELDSGEAGMALYVDQARPIVEGGQATISIQHGTRDRLTDNVTWSSATTINNNGTFDIRNGARFHRFRTSITGGFDKAMGVDVRVKSHGLR